MKSVKLATGLLMLAGLFAVVQIAGSQTTKVQEPDPVKAEKKVQSKTANKLKRVEILPLLEEEVDVAASPAKNLVEFLNWMQKELEFKKKIKFPIFLNEDTFRNEDPDAPPVSETPVKFSVVTPPVTVEEALKLVLAKVATRNATFLIRKGKVEITTELQAMPKNLQHESVSLILNKQPFGQALEELSEQTGLTVTIDPRIENNLKLPVTAIFANQVTMEAALAVLCDMVDVKPVFMRDLFYITTPQNAQVLVPLQKKLLDNPVPIKKPFPGPQIPGLPGA